MNQVSSKRIVSSLIGAILTVLIIFLIDKFSDTNMEPLGNGYWINKLILGAVMFFVFYFINGNANRK